MGRRGPVRTPTVKLALHDSHLARSRSKTEPQPETTKPRTATKLNSTERRIYNTTCKLLATMDLQAEPDGNAIARYAKNVVRYNMISAWVKEHGDTYPVHERHSDGTKTLIGVKRFPQSQIMVEMEMILLRLEREFGLTPSARAGLAIEKPKEAPRKRRDRTA